MGHQRLGTLPRTRLWKEVVELIGGGADVQVIAAATSQAAERSMMDASSDRTVQHAFWLLAKLPLAAREDNFVAALRDIGLKIEGIPTLADLICQMMEAVDVYTAAHGRRTDYGEIAQLSAAEALQAIVGKELDSLFGVNASATQSVLASFATVKQFAVLAREFFSKLTRRHLNYYLSRELSNHVGPGCRFASVREHLVFEEALDLHCKQATRIIEEYSGEWLSKQNHEGGIDHGKAGRFVSYASEKIRDELRHRRGAHVG